MKNEFVSTKNTRAFFELCAELQSPESRIGPSLAVVKGDSGRGKSEAAKYHAAQGSAVYVPPLNIRTPVMLLREITFELCRAKPGRSEECLNLIRAELARERRLVIIDEADLLPLENLEMLRNLNELYAAPILLIGEDDRLDAKIRSRRRLATRVRRRMEFGPLVQADVLNFIRQALGLKISPEACAAIHKETGGNWRPLMTAALDIERAMRASGLKELSAEILREVWQNGGRKPENP